MRKIIGSDAFFTIGATHEVCEDFALSSDKVIVVSDGCSGSSGSDVGARIVALAAMTEATKNTHRTAGVDCSLKTLFPVRVINHAANALGRLTSDNFVPMMLDCTMLVAYQTSHGHLDILCYGDGVVIARYDDDSIIVNELCSASFDNNTYPMYPSYLLDEGRALTAQEVYRDVSKEVRSAKVGSDVVNTQYNFLEGTRLYIPRQDELKSLTMCTDGFGSFSVEYDTQTIIHLARRMTDFKSSKGTFLKNRIKRVKKECVYSDVRHHDDIGIATLLFGEVDETVEA